MQNYIPRVSVETEVDDGSLDLQANTLMSINGILNDSDLSLGQIREAVTLALTKIDYEQQTRV